MTCNEVRFHITTELSGSIGSEASEHLESCEDCRLVWIAQQRLMHEFQSAKKAAPQVPEDVDYAVMRAFRQSFASREAASTVPKKIPVFRILAWASVAAAILVVLMLAMYRHAGASHDGIAVLPKEISVPPAPTQVASVTTPTTKAVKKARRPQRGGGKSPVQTQAVAATEPPASGFQNLMYCDALSCSGPMDLIRIQVPESTFQRGSQLGPRNGFVQADVVVGSDGVARAIRIIR